MSADEKSAIACTLTSADYRNRMAWIERLNRTALRNYRRERSRIELTYDATAAARVRGFVRREQHCCPFLDFSVHAAGDVVVLTIRSDQDLGDAADELFGAYSAGGGACSK